MASLTDDGRFGNLVREPCCVVNFRSDGLRFDLSPGPTSAGCQVSTIACCLTLWSRSRCSLSTSLSTIQSTFHYKWYYWSVSAFSKLCVPSSPAIQDGLLEGARNERRRRFRKVVACPGQKDKEVFGCPGFHKKEADA